MPLNLKRLLLVLLILPLLASAAGIGKINVKSSLGEPLNAEVGIYVSDPKELDLAVARLGSMQDYVDAGIPDAYVAGINVDIVKKSDGRYVIQLLGSQAVNDPYLELLVKLDTKTSNLMRQYTVLLDPPASVIKEEAPEHSANIDAKPSNIINQKTSKVNTAKATQDTPEPLSDETLPQTVISTATGTKLPDVNHQSQIGTVHASNETYTTQVGDVFGKIAQHYQPAGVPLVKVMAAFYTINKDAFVDGDMHKLKSGHSLRIPDQESLNNAGMLKHKKIAVKEPLAPAETVAAAKGQESKSENIANVPAMPIEKAPVTKQEPTPAKQYAPEVTPSVKADNYVLKVSPGDTSVSAKPNTDSANTTNNDSVKSAQPPLANSSSDGKNQQTPVVKAQNPSNSAGNTGSVAVANNAKLVPNPSFTETLSNYWNVILVGIGLILLCLILGMWVFKRRRKASLANFQNNFSPIFPQEELLDDTVRVLVKPDDVSESDDEELKASLPPNDDEMMEHQSTEMHLNEVDPLVEAELYMTYGRHSQAEGILSSALEDTPYKHELSLGLLKVYSDRKDLESFERVARSIQEDLKTAPPEQQGVWYKVQALASKLDPENPLYGLVPKPEPKLPKRKMTALERAQAAEKAMLDNLMPMENLESGSGDAPAPSLEFPMLAPKDEPASLQMENGFSEIDAPQKSNEIEFTLEVPAEKPVISNKENSEDTTEDDAEKLFSKLKKD